jgi:hypothetical protein
VDLCDAAYQALLGNLVLLKEDRESLRSRGLSDAEIDERGYRSMPADRSRRRMVARRVAETLGQVDLLRVPGFFVDRSGMLSVAGAPGIVIPVRRLDRLLLALKVRASQSIPGHSRYSYVSSTRYGGPGPGAPVHVPLVRSEDRSVVRVTEGELKADVATVLSGIHTFSVAGVGNWRPIVQVLRQVRPQCVRIAYDADLDDNPDVARARHLLIQALASEGFYLEIEVWKKIAKGIDDALLLKCPIRVVAA